MKTPKKGEIWKCNKTGYLYLILGFDGVVDYGAYAQPNRRYHLEAETFLKMMTFHSEATDLEIHKKYLGVKNETN